MRARHVPVAAAYLALVLWVLGSILPLAGESYPLGAGLAHTAVADQDQSHYIWAASRNARVLLTAPWRLPAFEYCYPFPGAVALGHHMYASGVLAMLPYALTGDPIIASNFVVLVMLWASAFGMYALAYHLTRSVSAAFVAGALFGFQFSRIVGAHWPAIVGNEWTPLALLFLHRTFTRRRWGDALALALFTGMQLLESVYQLLPLALYGSFLGVWLLVRHRATVGPLVPKLLVATALTAAILAVVAIPYVDVRETWGSSRVA